MFYSLQDVHDGFFKLFQPKVVVPLGATTLYIPVVYARKSNKSNDKKPLEAYPRIVALDQTISLSKDWRPNEEEFVVGYQLNEDENAYDKAWVTKAPMELIFEYQISGYFTNLQHKLAFMTWVFKNFRAFGGVLINPEILPDGQVVGDSVTYSMRTSEADRADGVFEYTLNFTLKPLVHLEKVTLLDLVERLGISVNGNGIIVDSKSIPMDSGAVTTHRDYFNIIDDIAEEFNDTITDQEAREHFNTI